jgi:hypothetical protein
MASLVPKLLFIGNQQTGFVYSSPPEEDAYAIIKSINVCNTSTASKVFSINLIPAGGALNVGNAILGNIALSGENVFSYETSIVMPNGSGIYIDQPDTSLTFTISGVEYVV